MHYVAVILNITISKSLEASAEGGYAVPSIDQNGILSNTSLTGPLFIKVKWYHIQHAHKPTFMN